MTIDHQECKLGHIDDHGSGSGGVQLAQFALVVHLRRGHPSLLASYGGFERSVCTSWPPTPEALVPPSPHDDSGEGTLRMSDTFEGRSFARQGDTNRCRQTLIVWARQALRARLAGRAVMVAVAPRHGSRSRPSP